MAPNIVTLMDTAPKAVRDFDAPNNDVATGLIGRPESSI